jgi:hypothetical protein
MQCRTTLQLAVRCAACMGVLATTSTVCRAQSFNIDIGAEATKPSKAYGAACGQAGRWMNMPAGLPLTQIPMTDTNGNTTRATALYTPAVALTFDDPQTKGDDEALLDDAQRLATAGVWTIAGLAPGNYDVLTYAWAPDDPLNYVTRVTVRGSSDAPQEVGGQIWTGSFVQGGQYARHRVRLAADGVLKIELDLVSNTAGTINGFQLVQSAEGTSARYCTAGVSGSGCAPTIHRIGAPRFLGRTFDAQGWYRDPPAPKIEQPTDGLHFVLGT